MGDPGIKYFSQVLLIDIASLILFKHSPPTLLDKLNRAAPDTNFVPPNNVANKTNTVFSRIQPSFTWMDG
jgi:hypothetical protein